MRDFQQYSDYIFNMAPSYQNVGSKAYKEGLSNTVLFDERLGNPHTKYKTIHIAGTNGKGSCSHTIASILQESGYKVGLYTSPHLLSFTERIRVNGKPIEEDYVMDFIDEHRTFIESISPSFFEVSTALAFKYFADREVDIAVIEVGLGGRLDCTNIITPILSIITNISLDHIQHLGNTLDKIAFEKAGIMKKGIPCVIGETVDETLPVFERHAKETCTPVIYCSSKARKEMESIFELKGLYQRKNINTILTSINELRLLGLNISDASIDNGLKRVIENTGLRGRWEQIKKNPTIVCDTGHNIGGFAYISQQLKEQKCKTLRIVFGMVNDKDISGVISLLPDNAEYYFCQASVKRALPVEDLAKLASDKGLKGRLFTSVSEAIDTAISDSSEDDFIFVGGSTFVVADLLKKRIN